MQEYIYSSNPDIESISITLMENLDKYTPESKPDINLFDKLANCDCLPSLLGDIGKDLQSFVKIANYNHPNLSLAINGLFSKSSPISIYLQECCDYAKCNIKTPILNQLIAEFLYKFDGFKSLCYFIKKPPISLLKDSNSRNQLRNHFNSYNYDFNNDEECYNCFNLLSDSFIPYVKGGEGFKKEINQNNKTIISLNQLGLLAQSQTLQRYNNELSNTVQDTYLGFVRILMSHVSIILAKQFGGYYKNNNIYLNNNFKDMGFSIECDDILYNPTIYPINKLPFELPNFSKIIFEKLENYAPINGLPIFDNYWVVMPSIMIPEKNNKSQFKYASKVYEGDKTSVKNDLNKILFNNGFVPILLGESKITDKCYFISYVI